MSLLDAMKRCHTPEYKLRREAWPAGHYIGWNLDGSLWEVTPAAPVRAAAKLGAADTAAMDWMLL